MWRIRSADRRDTSTPAAEVGAQRAVVDDPVGPRDLVAAVAVHGDAVEHVRRSTSSGRSGTSSRHVPYVAVQGRPAPTTTTSRPVGAGRRGERQAGRAVTDDRDVVAAHPWSSAAIRRNCSTTSGLRCVGSSVRYTVSTLTAMRPASPHVSKSWPAPMRALISFAASNASSAGVVARGRLGVDERQVVAHRGDAGLVGERPVARDDDVDVHAEHQVARGDPVRQRAGPHDRRAVDEQDVAGEDRPGVGHVDDRVALRVRRADLDQLDLAAGDVDA